MSCIAFGVFVERKNLDVDLFGEEPLDISGFFYEKIFNGIYKLQDFETEDFRVLDGKEPEEVIFIGRALTVDTHELVKFKDIAEVNGIMSEVCDFLDEMGIYRLTNPALCVLRFGF